VPEVAISPVAKGLSLVRAALAPPDSALRPSLYSMAKDMPKEKGQTPDVGPELLAPAPCGRAGHRLLHARHLAFFASHRLLRVPHRLPRAGHRFESVLNT